MQSLHLQCGICRRELPADWRQSVLDHPRNGPLSGRGGPSKIACPNQQIDWALACYAKRRSSHEPELVIAQNQSTGQLIEHRFENAGPGKFSLTNTHNASAAIVCCFSDSERSGRVKVTFVAWVAMVHPSY